MSHLMGVALRKESVDRNVLILRLGAPVIGSLSARRAWIEIFFLPRSGQACAVALRKESVDRNVKVFQKFKKMHRRSPQGERG